MASSAFHLFERFGVELEYMIVDADTLCVLPITDQLFRSVVGHYVSDVERGGITWSNELALHVLELKTTYPAASLWGLDQRFGEQVGEINRLLADHHARLMPTAMHPWMNPDRELRLWPHDNGAVYAAFDSIFDCRGHGWANLQSVHLNLPFAGDEEFRRLHGAIRLLLPILPALCASSPIVEGRITGSADTRLVVYRENARRLPQVSGQVVPEPARSQAEYCQRILQPLYAAIAPLDPQGLLQNEWLNARGAIARFDRSTIEIRVLDVQECPLADVAICWLLVEVLQRLIERTAAAEPADGELESHAFSTQQLAELLRHVTQEADQAELAWPAYLQLFGLHRSTVRAGELWRHLAEEALECPRTPCSEATRSALLTLVQEGPLARRILQAWATHPQPNQPAALHATYRRLCDCLATNTMFHAS